MIRAFVGLIGKDLRVLAADRMSLVFVAGFPLVFGVLFGVILSDRGDFDHLRIASADRSTLIESLAQAERITLVAVESDEQAARAVRTRKADAALIVHRHGPPPSVTILADAAGPVRSIIAGEVMAAAARASLGPTALESLVDMTYEPASHEVTPPDNTFALTFPQAIVWALIGAAASFGMALLIEHRSGVIMRLRVAPIPAWMILAAKATTCAIVSAAVAVALAFIFAFAFSVSIGRPVLLGVSIGCAAVAFSGVMVLIASLGRGREAAGQFAWAVLLVMAMTGGAMLPIAYMPEWLSMVSVVSPVRWIIESIEGATWREWGGERLALQWGGLVLVGLAAFGLGSRILSRSGLD